MPVRSWPILLGCSLLIAACADQDREARIRAPAVEVVGEPMNCIQTNRIQSSRVHDDYTIDFEMTGNEVLRNTLPHRCAGLGFEERFAHSSSTGQLCSVDTIRVLHTDGVPGSVCGLGRFVPVRYVEATAD